MAKLTAGLNSAQVSEHQMVVQGKIIDQNGAPQSNLMVKAFDLNIGAEATPLGQITTDEQGHYAIYYGLEKLGGKSAADLVISVSQDGKLLRESEVIFNAKPVEVKDFVMFAPASPEFERLSDVITPLLDIKIILDGLTKTHINFLSQKTNLSEQRIEWFINSHRLAGKSETLAVFYYALLAQSIPTDPVSLRNYKRASLKKTLQRAETLGLIAILKPKEVNRILDEVLPKLRPHRK